MEEHLFKKTVTDKSRAHLSTLVAMEKVDGWEEAGIDFVNLEGLWCMHLIHLGMDDVKFGTITGEPVFAQPIKTTARAFLLNHGIDTTKKSLWWRFRTAMNIIFKDGNIAILDKIY